MTLPSPTTTLFGIVATRAPVAAVFRRGPSKWWHVLRWDLQSGAIEHGAWLKGTLYPRRCDLSPDGELLFYFAMARVRPEFLPSGLGVDSYYAISKLPWLYALAAWHVGTTYAYGFHFVEGPPGARPWEVSEPQHGDVAGAKRRFGLARSEVAQYATERRRGWVEDERSPPRSPNDMWDQRRSAILTKPRPLGGQRLVLRDRGWIPDKSIEGRSPTYSVMRAGVEIELAGVIWADWDHTGRLLVATRDGRLEIRDVEKPGFRAIVSHDLSTIPRAPRPAPDSARHW